MAIKTFFLRVHARAHTLLYSSLGEDMQTSTDFKRNYQPILNTLNITLT